jgi:uncharacterized protein YbjT (DUF2867 family)
VILVTGATGNVGRHVVSRLLDVGADVRALTHRSDPTVLPEGAQLVPGDLSDPDSLERCLDGVDTVFLVWPQATAHDPLAAVDVIARHARRIVYVSSLTVDGPPAVRTHPMTVIHTDIEGAVRGSGLGWTFLRAGKFDTNALGWASEIRTTGRVRLPYPDAGRSPIHQRDLAEVAVRALTDEGHVGAAHIVTGPEMLTEGDLVRIIGEVIERPLFLEQIPPAVARREMLDQGVAPDLVEAALRYWALLVTEPEPVTATVERITGAPAWTFREWVEENADAFR